MPRRAGTRVLATSHREPRLRPTRVVADRGRTRTIAQDTREHRKARDRQVGSKPPVLKCHAHVTTGDTALSHAAVTLQASVAMEAIGGEKDCRACCVAWSRSARVAPSPRLPQWLTPVLSTAPLYNYEDAPVTPDADDPAIWVSRDDPRLPRDRHGKGCRTARLRPEGDTDSGAAAAERTTGPP